MIISGNLYFIVVEIILLAFILIYWFKTSKKAKEAQRQIDRLQKQAEEIIDKAHQTAVATLRQSADQANQLLSESSELKNEIVNEVETQVDTLAHEEKKLFKQSLAVTRQKTLKQWEEINAQLEKNTAAISEEMSAVTREQLTGFTAQMQEHFRQEMERLKSEFNQSIIEMKQGVIKIEETQEAQVAARLEATVDHLARRILRHSLDPTEQKKLVLETLAAAKKEGILS